MGGMNLFRIIQESLNNAIKHSNASQIDLNVTDNGDNIMVQISDNGDGFEMETVEKD